MIVVMQSRLCSTRLPGKAFLPFFGQNMIERSCSIAREIQCVDRIVLATGDRPENQIMGPFAKDAGAEFFCGSEDNVLERFYQAISGYQGEYLLRMTCDNYLIQPEVVERLYEAAVEKDADYAYVAPLSHFSGEIIRCDTLRKCYEGDYSEEAMEHVTWDIRNNGNNNIVALEDNLLGIDHNRGITLDTLDDLIRMKTLEREYPSLRSYRCLQGLKQLQMQT